MRPEHIMEPMILGLCLAVLVSLGILERTAARRARAAVPIRIHVNGTRGKSTVTRLIAAALREAGMPTLAKVTGTAPRLVLPDGSEAGIRRLAPANVHEQAWVLRRARHAGARAVVVECMAVRPDLQWVSEREMLRATIGVITNVRRDHTDVMGRTLDDIARTLANTTPKGGVLVVGDARFAEIVRPRCAALGTRLVIADTRHQVVGPGEADPQSEGDHDRRPRASGEHGPQGEAEQPGRWWQEDVAVALAVTRELGIDDETALAGMRTARPDPGAVAQGVATVAGRRIQWVDATAANDPESLDLLLASRPEGRNLRDEGASRPEGRNLRDLIVYNHRADRPERLRTFAAYSKAFGGSSVILLTGDRPSMTLVAAIRRSSPEGKVRFVPQRLVVAALETALRNQPRIDSIVFAGNTRGFANFFTPGRERPTNANDQRPTTSDQRPATNDQRPATNDQRPTTSDQRPTTSD